MNALKWLAAIVLSQIVTALVAGQPLTALVKRDTLGGLFIHGAVPAWAFSVSCFVAMLGCIYVLPQFFHRRFLPRKPSKLHFVPDARNSGWSAGSNSQMQVKLAGTFLYEGKTDLILLKGFLNGTRPCADWRVELPGENDQRPIRLETLGLRPHMPVRAYVTLEVKPLVKAPGKAYKGSIRFLDQYNHVVTTDVPVKLPYIDKA